MWFFNLFVFLPLSLVAGSIIGIIGAALVGGATNQLGAEVGFWLTTIISSCYFFSSINGIMNIKPTNKRQFRRLANRTSRKHSSGFSFLLGYFCGSYRD